MVYQAGAWGFDWACGNSFLKRSGTTPLVFYCSDADAVDLLTIIVTLIIPYSFACKEIRFNLLKCENYVCMYVTWRMKSASVRE